MENKDMRELEERLLEELEDRNEFTFCLLGYWS